MKQPRLDGKDLDDETILREANRKPDPEIALKPSVNFLVTRLNLTIDEAEKLLGA